VLAGLGADAAGRILANLSAAAMNISDPVGC
jgi:hypothetical protein